MGRVKNGGFVMDGQRHFKKKQHKKNQPKNANQKETSCRGRRFTAMGGKTNFNNQKKDHLKVHTKTRQKVDVLLGQSKRLGTFLGEPAGDFM